MVKKPQSTPESPSKKSLPEKVAPTLEAEIERQIGTLVSQGQRQEIVARLTKLVYRESFSGPIAHPRHLREYEEIVPGSAERIIRMAEKALEHRAEMDTKIVDAEIADQKRGMNFGLAALFLILGLATLFGYWKMQVVAGMFLTTAVLGAIPVFVMGRQVSNGNGEEKAK
jgi:uncharacterized membrane protein